MLKNPPSVVAVVLNWNGYEDTVNCVRSLEDVEYTKLEIVIVDNGSSDGSAETLSRTFPKHTLISLETNGGYAAGNNAGIRYALDRGTEFVLIVNNDVVVDSEFLEPMIRVGKENPSVGIVTCKAFFQSDQERIYTTAGRLSRIRCSGAPRPRRLINREGEATYISGCVLLVKREVFETVGSFDERFFMYFEDVEFSRRVKGKFKIYYTPKAVVYHKSGGGKGWTSYNSTYLYYTARNRFLVFRNDNTFYQLYVLLFSIGVALGKSLVIALTGRSESRGKRLGALWKGMADGVIARRATNESQVIPGFETKKESSPKHETSLQ